MDEAVELGKNFYISLSDFLFNFQLGKRAICHATYRDAASGGVVRGNFPFLNVKFNLFIYAFINLFFIIKYILIVIKIILVYHVHNNGWTKIIEGIDVNKLHYE